LAVFLCAAFELLASSGVSSANGLKADTVTAIEVMDAHGDDSSQLGPPVEKTAENFMMNSVCVDKASSSN